MDYIWWMLGYENTMEKPVAQANLARENRRNESQKRRQQRKSYQKDKCFREAEAQFKLANRSTGN